MPKLIEAEIVDQNMLPAKPSKKKRGRPKSDQGSKDKQGYSERTGSDPLDQLKRAYADLGNQEMLLKLQMKKLRERKKFLEEEIMTILTNEEKMELLQQMTRTVVQDA